MTRRRGRADQLQGARMVEREICMACSACVSLCCVQGNVSRELDAGRFFGGGCGVPWL